MSAAASFLGRGWSFPMRAVRARGRLDYAAGPEKVRQSILHHPRHRAGRAHHAARRSAAACAAT